MTTVSGSLIIPNHFNCFLFNFLERLHGTLVRRVEYNYDGCGCVILVSVNALPAYPSPSNASMKPVQLRLT
jgi:hypothetical protein